VLCSPDNYAAASSNRSRGHAGVRVAAGLLAALACALGLTAPASADSCPPPAAPCKTGLRALPPHRIAHLLAAGEPVFLKCVVIGNLDVQSKSRTMTSPIVVRDSCIAGGVRGHSTTFQSIVDLSGTTILGPVNFYSSEFDRVAAFDSTQFRSRVTFAVATFHGAATFYTADFLRRVTFTDTSFERGANFSGAQFESLVSFEDANFGQQSRFSLAEFYRPVSFQSTRFGGGSDFTGTQFDAPVTFQQAASQGDLGFQTAHFTGTDTAGVDFSSVLLGGTADFSGAGKLPGPAVFDQAIISSLDLSGASVDSLGTPSRIEKLKIAPETLAGITFLGSRAQLEADYQMLETAARNADDLAAANEAKVLRHGLQRQDEPAGEHQLDYALYWGIGGYFVRPWHPFFALLVLFLIGIVVRGIAHRHEREGVGGAVKGMALDARGAFRSFRRDKSNGKPHVAAQFEVALYAVLVLVLIANMEMVSPPIRNLVEGLL